jgi:hypothetical protein
VLSTSVAVHPLSTANERMNKQSTLTRPFRNTDTIQNTACCAEREVRCVRITTQVRFVPVTCVMRHQSLTFSGVLRSRVHFLSLIGGFK